MTKKAVLDLGTNTFHLLIAEISEKRVAPIVQKTVAVKLGEGGINRGFITKEALERGIDAIRSYARLIDQHEVVKIRAVGTAALRSASNGTDFINRIREETGITIEIIDGALEASLIYEGVRHGVRMDEKPVLIMDIGGGSVEFIIGNAKGIFWKKSYPIGAARLMDLFHKSDPITTEEISQIEDYVSTELQELKQECATYSPKVLIGSAGSFETFAALYVSFFDLEKNLLNETEFEFDRSRYGDVSNWIISSTHAERVEKPEIIPVRVDMIVIATVLTNLVLRELNIEKLKLSTYALKEGLLFGD